MKKVNRLVTHVHQYLEHEYELVRGMNTSFINSHLSLEEQTLIYKYSEDGYESVNRSLRISMGKRNTPFGKFLNVTLEKLPDYRGVVYRSANLSLQELKRDENSLTENIILVEYSFISTSMSYTIANMFGGNCRFEIISKRGKDIGAYVKYGVGSGQNEYEVLFKPNGPFTILDITKKVNYTLIIMEEA